MKFISTVVLLFSMFSCYALETSKAPEGAEVYFISPQDGAEIEGPVHVGMGLKGMGIAPAGTQVENTGHHHLIINAKTPASGVPIKKDEQHRHFGGGQTETTIELAPGEYTLQLVLGDFAHRPHEPAVTSEVITITVK